MQRTRANKRVTIRDVAALSGVSLATVSRVINNYPHVDQEKRIRVERAIQELGFRVGAIAKVLYPKSHKKLGLLLPFEIDESTNLILQSIIKTAALRKSDLELIFLSEEESHNGLRTSTFERVRSAELFGLILFEKVPVTPASLSSFPADLPLVIFGSEMVKNSAVNYLQFDYLKVANEHLIPYLKESNKKPVIVDFYTRDSLTNYLTLALSKNHDIAHSFNRLNVANNFDAAFGFFLEYLATHKNSLFVVPNDTIATSIIKAALSLNLSVPNDVEVISILGSQLARIFAPSISSINIDFNDLGTQIFDLIKGDNMARKNTIIECYFVARQSTMQKEK